MGTWLGSHKLTLHTRFYLLQTTRGGHSQRDSQVARCWGKSMQPAENASIWERDLDKNWRVVIAGGGD